jgi:hypothetical protein
VVVTAVLIFILTRPSDPGTGSPSPTTPSVSAISTQATEVAPFSTGTTAITGTEATLTDPIGFVQSYYGQLPGNTDAAWALLGSTAQSQSGGRGAFDAFYAGMSRVWAEDLRVSGNTVTATIVFTQKTGSVSRGATSSSSAQRMAPGHRVDRALRSGPQPRTDGVILCTAYGPREAGYSSARAPAALLR